MPHRVIGIAGIAMTASGSLLYWLRRQERPHEGDGLAVRILIIFGLFLLAVSVVLALGSLSS